MATVGGVKFHLYVCFLSFFKHTVQQNPVDQLTISSIVTRLRTYKKKMTSPFNTILLNPGLESIVVKVFKYLKPLDLIHLCLVSRRCQALVFDLFRSRLSTLYVLICTNHNKYQEDLLTKFIPHSQEISLLDAKMALEYLLSNFKCSKKSVDLLLTTFPALKNTSICHQRTIQVDRQNGATSVLKFLCDLSHDGFYHQGDLVHRILSFLKFEKRNRTYYGNQEKDFLSRLSLMQLATKSRNRDAVIALLLYWKNPPNPPVYSKLLWTEMLVTLVHCTSTNSCQDFGRLEHVRRLLDDYRANFPISQDFAVTVKCPEMKTLLLECFKNPRKRKWDD